MARNREERVQCLTCQWLNLTHKPRGFGVCFKEAKAGKLGAIEVRVCASYKLGAMHTVKSRSKRKMIFDDFGIVRLV